MKDEKAMNSKSTFLRLWYFAQNLLLETARRQAQSFNCFSTFSRTKWITMFRYNTLCRWEKSFSSCWLKEVPFFLLSFRNQSPKLNYDYKSNLQEIWKSNKIETLWPRQKSPVWRSGWRAAWNEMIKLCIYPLGSQKVKDLKIRIPETGVSILRYLSLSILRKNSQF